MSRSLDINKAIEATVVRAVRSQTIGKIRDLEKQISRISVQLQRVAAARAAGPRSGTAPARPVSKGRQIHGRYIGLLRHLPKKEQVRVRAIRLKQGVHAAIRAAEKVKKA